MKVVLASSNRGKLAEFASLLSDCTYDVLAQSEFNIEDAIENGDSFDANALIKARHASAQSGLSAIADDSGLVVAALDGAPGIYSARFAGPNANDADNIELLLRSLKDVPENERTAYFHLGKLIEVGNTKDVFTMPKHELTENYITGRFG